VRHDDYCGRAKRYAERVVSGQIPACKWVRLACERQLKELKDGVEGFRFEEEKGNRLCRFVELLPHAKGRWNTKTIRLEDWQCFLLTTVFGWIDADGFRRFRSCYVEIPRKNGKSSMCAAVGLYMLTADEEPGAEVYSAAVTRDQAKIVFGVARYMALHTPAFRARYGLEVHKYHLYVPRTGSVFRPLASDADALHGLNVHCGIIDELHRHKSREVFDALDTSTGSRRQPLKWIITTAGTDKENVCYEQRTFITQVLEGRVTEAKRQFGMIYTLDPEDDWTSPASWKKANPNYGVSVLRDEVEMLAAQAHTNPNSAANFRTRHLNLWLSTGVGYFNMLAWGRCKRNIAESDYEGYPCWFGLDLASKWDVAAFMRIYRAEDHWAVFGDYYLPEDAVEKGKPNYDLYAGWAQQGRMTLTPGPIIDFAFIERDLADWARRVNPKEICYDPYQATELATRMSQEGLPMVEIPIGDPVLSWMLGNVVAKEDVKGNVYPRKERRENKIDGPVAAMMALSRALSAKEPEWGYADPAMVYV